MTLGGRISALVCDNHIGLRKMKLTKVQFYDIQYFFSKENLSKVNASSFSTDFSSISNRNVKTELTVQLLALSGTLVTYICSTSVCRYRAFHHVPEEFLFLYPDIFNQKLAINH